MSWKKGGVTMADILDVTMSTVCDASVMCQTFSEYGDGSMGNGILKYGNEMLATQRIIFDISI